MHLIEYVRALEGRDNWTRGQQVLAALAALGIEPTVQECRWPKIRNIIVDFSPEPDSELKGGFPNGCQNLQIESCFNYKDWRRLKC